MNNVYHFEFASPALETITMLRQTWLAFNRLAEIKLAKAGLTPETLMVLWTCKDYPQPLIPAEIARITHRENQTIAGLLNRMEKDGLVQRIPKRKGKPFTEVKITPKGEQLCDAGQPIMKALVSDVGAGLSVEQHEQFHGLAQVLRDKSLEKLYLEPVSSPVNPPGTAACVRW